jgi:spore maturation protein CgeB
MKILYAGVRFDNYDPKRRHSFEYQNFYLTLKSMAGVTVIEHPFDRIVDVGVARYNEELLEIVERERPDLFFAFMYTDELDPETLLKIKEKTKSVAWFADDYWRFFNYSKHWPPYFTSVITTYSRAVDWYRADGHANVILSQWGCNTTTYKPIDTAKDIDVSFVGQRKSGRVKTIEELRRAGIVVESFGFGWRNGKISQEEMMRIFSGSKIALNLTDRKSLWDPSVIARIFLKKSVNRIVPDLHLVDNFRAYQHFSILHTHARPFELAGCGAFVISGWSEDIGAYYKEGKEMIFYRSTAELAEKIKYYLAHDAERESIARAGYERTIHEHTYEKRFTEIFKAVGLKND